MPVSNERRAAAWRAAFNDRVRAIWEPTLLARGYALTLDHVVEEVEPDTNGPFYIGEVGFTRPLGGPAGERSGHLVARATTGTGTERATLTVELFRNGAGEPPNWLSEDGPVGGACRRVARRSEAGGRTIWSFGTPTELRAALDELLEQMIGADATAPSLSWLEAADPPAGTP